VIYRAAAALPHTDRGSACDALRGQLRVMARAGRGTPDWTTFAVTGPVDRAGEERSRFEWTASVAVDGAERLDTGFDSDVLRLEAAVVDSTVPFPAAPAA
jgi:hypothetical protein